MRPVPRIAILLVLAGLSGCATTGDLTGMVRGLGDKLSAALTGSGTSGFAKPTAPPATACDWRALGHPRDAAATAQACAEAVRAHPQTARLQLRYGRALAASGKLAEAARAYGEALRLDPEYAEAQNALAELIERGAGIATSPAEAVRRYRRAAHAGLASAAVNLGRVTIGGLAGEPDAAEAIRWFERAAGQGSAEAEAALGAAYEHGVGVGRDPAAAARWYARAAEQGYDNARAGLDRLAARGVVGPRPSVPAADPAQPGREDPPEPGTAWPALLGPPAAEALVDPRTGELSLAVTDLAVPAGAILMEVRRVLQAGPAAPGLLGSRWRLEWERRLVREETGLRLAGAAGGLTFARHGPPGSYRAAGGEQLVVDAIGGAVLTRPDGTSERYDGSGRLVEHDRRNGNRVRLRYDADGRLIRVDGPRGQSLHLVLDERGRAIRIAVAGGPLVDYGHAGDELVQVSAGGDQALRYAYGAQGELTRLFHPRTGVTEIAYDPRGRVVARRTADGAQERHEYDDAARLSRRIDAAGAATTTRWSADGQQEEVTDAGGHATVIERDQAGRIVRVTGPGGITTRADYDELGRPVAVTDPAGRVVRTEYAGDTSYPRTVTLPDGTRRVHEYDAQYNLRRITLGGETLLAMTYAPDGLPASVKVQGQPEEKLAYDTAGRLVARTDPLGRTARNELDAAGRLRRRVDATGAVTTLAHDAAARTVTVTDAAGATTRIEYEPNGLPVKVTGPTGGVTTYAYDALSRVTRLTESPGGTTQYGYDAAGRLASLRDAAGHTWRFEYDARGRLVREVDPQGGAVTRTYDALGRLTGLAAADGATTRYAYTPDGLLQRVTDPRGGTTTLAYDALGQLAGETDPLGRTLRYERDPQGRIRRVTQPDGAAERYDYDVDGRLTRVVDALGGVTALAWDPLGRLTAETAPDGRTTRYEYGATGRLERLVEPGGLTTRFTYDPGGRPATATDPAGRVTRHETDAAGQLARVVRPGEPAAVLRHDPAGRVVAAVAAGRETRIEPDAVGRIARVTGAAGLEVSYRYDARGQLAGWKDGLGGGASFDHDAAGRVTAIIEAAAKAPTRYRYDAAGALVEATNPLGQATRLAYTAAGELAGVETATRDAARYEYDAAGRLAVIHAPGGGATRFAYDALGRMIASTDAAGRRRAVAYDPAGRVVSTTDARGQVTTLAYDAAGRLAQRRFADGQVVHYRYDERGDLVEVDDGRFPVRYAYDEAGRLARVEYPAIRRSLAWEYAAEGRPAKRVDTDGGVTAYGYDAAGRLVRITGGGGQALELEYDPGDRLVGLRYPNGVRGRVEYDAAGRQTRIVYADPKGKPVAGWRYAYDDAGNRVETAADGGRPVRHRYDAAGQLVEEDRGEGATIRFRYGPGGNRQTLERGGTTTAYRYDPGDRLVEAGSETFTHDANGNLVERRGPGGVTRYEWDARDRLAKVVRPDGETVTFGYAPTGERVWRRDASGLTWFVTDGLHVLAELDEGLRPRATYLHGPGIDQPLGMVRGGRRQFLHADALGSVIALTDETGAVAARYEYDPFGAVRRVAGDADSPFAFTGREWDAAIGLYYYRARYYDPGLGRFLSVDPEDVDPTDPLTLNPYQYALNNPLRFTDPFGAFPLPGDHPAYPIDRPRIVQVPQRTPGLYGEYLPGKDRIEMSPMAGAPESPSWQRTAVHETDHRRMINARIDRQARQSGMSTPVRSEVARKNLLEQHRQELGKMGIKPIRPTAANRGDIVRAAAEQRAYAKQAKFGTRVQGLPVDHPEIQRYIEGFERYGGDRKAFEKWLRNDAGRPAGTGPPRNPGRPPAGPGDLEGLPAWMTPPPRPQLTGLAAGVAAVAALDCVRREGVVECGKQFGQGVIISSVVSSVGGAIGSAAAPALGATSAVGAAVGATVAGAVLTTYGTVKAVQAAATEWTGKREAEQELAQRRAEAEAQGQVNLARIDRTLAGLEARYRGLEAQRAAVLAARDVARQQAARARALRNEAAARVEALRGHEAALKSAAGLCAEAQQLAAQLEADAARAQSHADQVVQALSRADGMVCRTSADARTIDALYRNAEGLTRGVRTESERANSAFTRYQEVRSRLRAVRAISREAEAAAGTAVSLAPAAEAAFTQTGSDVERGVSLAPAFARARAELIADTRTIALVFPQETWDRFRAMRDRAAALALPGDDASGAIGDAQTAAAETRALADQARAIAARIAATPVCELSEGAGDATARADAAATLAEFALSRSQHLPQVAADCTAATQPPPPPPPSGPTPAEIAAGLLPQLVDIYNRGAGGGRPPSPGVDTGLPRSGGGRQQPQQAQACSGYQSQLQSVFGEQQRLSSQLTAAQRAGNSAQSRALACQLVRNSDRLFQLAQEMRSAGCPVQGPIEQAAAQNRTVGQQLCR